MNVSRIFWSYPSPNEYCAEFFFFFYLLGYAEWEEVYYAYKIAGLHEI